MRLSAVVLDVVRLAYRAWDLGEEKDKEVQKFPLNRGDNQRRSKGGAGGGRPAPGPRLMGAPPGALALI